jgi:hypothetical protein
MRRAGTALIALTLLTVLAAQPAHADRGDRWDPGTVGMQLGTEVTFGLLGGVGLGTAGLVLGGAVARPGDWGPPAAGGFLGMVIGAGGGMILGVQYIGDRQGGTGRAWATSTGATVGVIGGLTFAYYTGNVRRSLRPLALAGGAAVLLAGPILGYHLSADAHAPTAAPRTFIVPLFGGGF